MTERTKRNSAAPGRGSSMEEPEAQAEGKGFVAGAEEAAEWFLSCRSSSDTA